MWSLPPFQPLIALLGLVVGLVALYLLAFGLPIAAFFTFSSFDAPAVAVVPFHWINGVYYANPINFGAGFVLGFIINYYLYARSR